MDSRDIFRTLYSSLFRFLTSSRFDSNYWRASPAAASNSVCVGLALRGSGIGGGGVRGLVVVTDSSAQVSNVRTEQPAAPSQPTSAMGEGTVGDTLVVLVVAKRMQQGSSTAGLNA